jgi:hypothetical protein
LKKEAEIDVQAGISPEAVSEATAQMMLLLAVPAIEPPSKKFHRSKKLVP